MSEPKLCPYRYDIEWDDHFLPCLEDKCAMWRERRVWKPLPHQSKTFPIDGEWVEDGHCGLAGKP